MVIKAEAEEAREKKEQAFLFQGLPHMSFRTPGSHLTLKPSDSLPSVNDHMAAKFQLLFPLALL